MHPAPAEQDPAPRCLLRTRIFADPTDGMCVCADDRFGWHEWLRGMALPSLFKRGQSAGRRRATCERGGTWIRLRLRARGHKGWTGDLIDALLGLNARREHAMMDSKDADARRPHEAERVRGVMRECMYAA